MNQFLQNNLLALVLFMLLIILMLVGVLSFVVFKLLTQKDLRTNLPSSAKNIPKPIVEKFYCHNHKDQPTTGSCLICEDVFCENCLVEHEGLFFCKEHFKTYANHKWKQITDFKTTPVNPEDGMFIYDFKRKIWSKKGLPSFVVTHYKINVEEDLIESHIQLHVREEDEAEFIKGLSAFIK